MTLSEIKELAIQKLREEMNGKIHEFQFSNLGHLKVLKEDDIRRLYAIILSCDSDIQKVKELK